MKAPNSVNSAAMTAFKKVPGVILGKKCARKYNEGHRPARNAEQRDAVNGKPCWECKGKAATGVAPYRSDGKIKRQMTRVKGKKDLVPKAYRTHDHQPPLCIAWEMGGCHMGKADFLAHFSTAESVLPHCEKHYRSQGTPAGKYAKHMRASA